MYVCVEKQRSTSSTVRSFWADWWRWRPTTPCSCTQMRATFWEVRAASSTSSVQWSTTSRTAWSKASSWNRWRMTSRKMTEPKVPCIFVEGPSLHHLETACQAHGPKMGSKHIQSPPQNSGTPVCFSLLQTLISDVRYVWQFTEFSFNDVDTKSADSEKGLQKF